MIGSNKKLVKGAAGASSISPIAWDVTTFKGAPDFTINGTLLSDTADTTSPYFFDNGNKLYFKSSSSSVDYYILTTPYDLTTAVFQNTTNNIAGDISFQADGSHLFSINAGVISKFALSTPWDPSTKNNVGVQSYSFLSGTGRSVLLQGLSTSVINNVVFKPDGTRLFIHVKNSQYTGISITYDLATPWDLTTLSLASNLNGFGVTAFATPFKNFWWSNSGDILFRSGSNTVQAYPATTPFDISTVPRSYTQSFTFSYSFIDGLRISPNGLYLFTARNGSGPELVRHTMSTAYDLSTLSSNPDQNQSIDPRIALGSGATSINDYDFSIDGTKFYINAGGLISQYNLTTAWDLSTATFISSITQASTYGLALSPDGKYLLNASWNGMKAFYMSQPFDLSTASGQTNVSIIQRLYHLDLATPQFLNNDTLAFLSWYPGIYNKYSIAKNANGLATSMTAQFTQVNAGEEILGSQSSSMTSMSMSPDGSNIYMTSSSSVRSYNLSTAWSLSQPSNVGPNSVTMPYPSSSASNDQRKMLLNSDGSKAYFGASSTAATQGRLLEVTLTNPFEIQGVILAAAYEEQIFIDPALINDLNITNGWISTLALSGSGSKLVFHFRYTYSRLMQQSMGTPYDVSTLIDNSGEAVSGKTVTHAMGGSFANNGLFFFYGYDYNKQIYRIQLGTAYDITTASTGISTTFNGAANGITIANNVKDVVLSPDGTKLFFLSSNCIAQFTLTTPFDLSTSSNGSATPDWCLPTEGSEGGLKLNPDGTKIYYLKRNAKSIEQFSMTTPYDLSTASYDGSYDASWLPEVPGTFEISPIGDTLYFTNNFSVLQASYQVE